MKAALVLLVLSAFCIADPKPPIGVPADAKYFNGKWYKVFVEKAKTWNVAKSRAESMRGGLAIAADKPAFDFIASIAKGRTLWIGCSKGDDELWLWTDGSELKLSEWGPNQPENGPGEKWLVISGGKLHDHHGKGGVPIVGFICEWSGSFPAR